MNTVDPCFFFFSFGLNYISDPMWQINFGLPSYGCKMAAAALSIRLPINNI